MSSASKHLEARLPSRPTLGLLLVLVLVVAVYRGAFLGYFVQDDYGWLESSRFQSLSAYLKCFTRFNPALTYRPLSQETFFWLGQAFFGLNPTGYHAISLAFHITGCALVYALLRCFFSPVPSLAGSLFYGIHGAHQRSVYWISALPEPMALCFFVAAVLLFIKYDRAGSRKEYVLSLACMAFGMMSKESILTVPLVLAAYAVLFSPRRLLWTAPFFCASAGYTLVRLTSSAVRAAPYPLTFGRAVWANLHAYFSWASGLTETMLKVKLGWVAEHLYGWVALVFIIVIAALFMTTPRRKAATLALVWFAVALQPVLYFRQHIDPYYLAPSLAGLSILLAAACPDSFSRKTMFRSAPVALILVFTAWSSTTSVKLEGRWWNARSIIGRDILARMPKVDSQVPAGHIAYVFGFGEAEFGIMQKDAALKAFGFPPDRFVLFGLDPDTSRQIRNLALHGGLVDYYCFVYRRGEFSNMTDAFRRRPERFINPVELEVQPLEVQAGRDTLVLKATNLDARAIDVAYTLDGVEMPPIYYWPLDPQHTATLHVDNSTRKGSYHFTAIRDAEEREAWYPVDVRVTVR
jgi:hypothetical protein